MPNMDGLQALKKIREADPSAKIVNVYSHGPGEHGGRRH